jgi:iron complex transport system substrate-binding protein
MAKFIIGFILAALAGLFAACAGTAQTVTPLSSTSPAPATLTVTDQLGRTVTVKASPQSIVSVAPSNTEIVYALGLADRLVAVTDYDNYPPEVKEKPSIGGFSTPNIEQVVAMAPDLVLATSIHQAKVIPQLEARGVTVLALNPKTIDQVFEAIELVGRVTGVEKEAAALTASMRQRVKAVTDKTAGLAADQKPRVFYIVWHDPLMIAGVGTLHDELIGLAGGINLGHDLAGYADISLENVIVANPQVMIAGVGMGTGEDLPLQYLNSEPRLADTDARKNHQVYAIDTDVVGRPGPRIVDALEQCAGFIHPELFGEKP